MKTRIIITTLFLLLIESEGLLYAASSKVVTYFPAPIGDYMDIKVSGALTVGSAAVPSTANSFYCTSSSALAQTLLEVKNNKIDGWNSTTHGGNLRIEGNLDIQNNSGTSLFYVNSSTNRVGVGTTSPLVELDVRGEAKSMIVAAHESITDSSKPWAEMFAQYNTYDIGDAITANGSGSGARFTSVYTNSVSGNIAFGTLHLDAKPIYIQAIDKSAGGLTVAQNHGRVVIRGYYDPLMTASGHTAANLILVVGEPDTSYPSGPGGYLPVALANEWVNGSSRLFKKDIAPLSPADYQLILSKLASLDIVHYLYKSEASTNRIHTGFIAEEAPSEIVGEDGKSVSQQDEIGFLLASLKALKMENQEIEKRISRLQS